MGNRRDGRNVAESEPGSLDEESRPQPLKRERMSGWIRVSPGAKDVNAVVDRGDVEQFKGPQVAPAECQAVAIRVEDRCHIQHMADMH